MRRWVLVLGLCAGCDDLGTVEVRWTVTLNGAPSTCETVGGVDVQYTFSTGDLLDEQVPCASGVATRDFYSGDTTMRLSLLDDARDELAVATVPLHVATGETATAAVVFDVTP